MDNSEIRIKMCEKAVEIQALMVEKSKLGWVRSSYINHLVIAIDKKGEVYISSETLVWLPRQDQLQEIWLQDIAKATPSIPLAMMNTFYIFNTERQFPHKATLYSCQFNSMEQLWLAFVMKEKYNKVWNGEDWISA